MPPEGDQAPAQQDTPEVEAPEAPVQETAQDTATETGDNWEERYQNLHPEYTRATQQLSQYEQLIQGAQAGDPEALGLLGLEIEQPEEEYDFEEDPVQGLQSKVEALEARLAQEDEQVQQQQYLNAEIDFVNEGLSAVNEQVKKETGQELSQEAIDAIGDLSRTDRFREEDGAPNVRAAFEHLQQIREADRKAYTSGKRKAALPPEGIPGSEKVNLKDEQSRQAAMARVMEAEEAD